MTSDFSPFPKSDIVVYKPRDYAENPPENFREGGFERYLYYSAYLTQSDLSRIEELLKTILSTAFTRRVTAASSLRGIGE